MQCDCEACRGTGEIPCPDCDGEGRVNRSILTVNIKAIRRLDAEGMETLLELQRDALRCQQQAARLTELNPAAAESYAWQLGETLAKLEQQADDLLK